MYTTCMFCGRPLGENTLVEHFPIGRRLAFDAERGRLWVVCRKCERWNLTPIEERWEAIETCERLFSATRVRVSTEQIGLARHAEGLELVRIGRPLRPEFAAWRYGDQFGRRRRRMLLYGVGAAAAFGGIVIGGAAAGILSGTVLSQTGNIWNLWANARPLAKLRTDDGRTIRLMRHDLVGTRLRADGEGDGFVLGVRKRRRTEWFSGEEARRHAGVILPAFNRAGARRDAVQVAVAEIERLGHPERFLADLSTGDRFRDRKGVPGYVNKMPAPTKLALEMALHEEQERRALEGELWLLERAWREAEEIAAISDDLLLPEGTEETLERYRRGEDDGA
ncbi:MAG TPA: hypothetical protein VFQ22_06255 [Longimicrobiales bacterium]|nr:hypothetical protein [Longimicrobiales bacterium]